MVNIRILIIQWPSRWRLPFPQEPEPVSACFGAYDCSADADGRIQPLIVT